MRLPLVLTSVGALLLLPAVDVAFGQTEPQSIPITGKLLPRPATRPIPMACLRTGAPYISAHTPGARSYECELALGNEPLLSLEDLERGIPMPDPRPALTSTDPANGANVSTSGPACGNPAMLSTGNKVETVTDYRSEGQFPLEIVRRYNGNSGMFAGMFGRGWMSKFDLQFIIASYDDPDSWSDEYGAYLNQIYEYRLYRDDGSTIALSPLGNGNYSIIGRSLTHSRVDKTSTDELTYFAPDGSKEIYKLAWHGWSAKIKKIINPVGITWTFEYLNAPNGMPQLSRVVHSNGRALTFQWQSIAPYGAWWHIAQIADPDGNNYRYEWPTFDGFERVRVVYPSTPINIYGTLRSDTLEYVHAGGPAPLLLHKYINGQVFASFDYYGFSDAYRVKTSQHAGGVEKFEFSYNAGARTTTVTNPLGAVATYTFSADSELISTQGSAATYCPASNSSMVRDSNGLRTVETGEDGRQVETTYDTEGNVVKRVEGYGSAMPIQTIYEWRNQPRRLWKERTALAEIEYSYDGANRISAKKVTSLVPGMNYGLALTTAYTTIDSDGNGMPEQVIVDGPLPGDVDKTTYSFDAYGNLVQEQTFTATVTYGGHNASGRPAQITDVNGVTTYLVYDARGRVISSTTGGAQRLAAFDIFGSPLQTRSADGTVQNYEYDGALRMTGLNQADSFRPYVVGGSSVTNRMALTLDASGNITSQARKRDWTALLLSFTDYDELGRMRKQRGNYGQQTVFQRTPGGLPYRVTDSTGLVIALNTYDVHGRLVSTVDAKGSTTQFSYDLAGNLAQVVDPRGLATGYTYDGFGNLTGQTSPDTGVTSFGFDAYGRKTSASAAGVMSTTYSYGSDGRVSTVTSTRGSNTITRSFTYDTCAYGRNRLCSATENTGEHVEYTYTPLGAVQTKTDIVAGQRLVTQWNYLTSGQVSQLIYPNGSALNFGWQDGLLRSPP